MLFRSSNIEGYASVITHGDDGLLVPPKDEEMLAQALISLITDESYRQQMGDRGALKAKKYSWEHIAQRVLSYYTRVLSEPPWKERFPEGKTISSVLPKDGR